MKLCSSDNHYTNLEKKGKRLFMKEHILGWRKNQKKYIQNKKEKYTFLFELFIQRVFLSAIITLNDIDMLCAI